MKNKIYKIPIIIFIICFISKTAIDYKKYLTYTNSAPFYIFVITNIIYFIMPAVILLIIYVIKNKKENKNG